MNIHSGSSWLGVSALVGVLFSGVTAGESRDLTAATACFEITSPLYHQQQQQESCFVFQSGAIDRTTKARDARRISGSSRRNSWIRRGSKRSATSGPVGAQDQKLGIGFDFGTRLDFKST